ncbi:DNA polymerase III subunit alpha [Pseudooceanicola sp. CBS1P-1]|uniref:DNA polymerase III subunit alpha n=1 Tax=Pseudooceanicola albus TaxID=2692189 RepID=A0A6L7GBW5_9RHOB|nr:MULTISPECIES: DNA polymerase III subunit alpha [Pseudooceanicola]MBT9386922.1 DNA polymerase III subunit alpha [Pseudooceanicola endophyticus]MXN21028.1 DNA polymerase III subunit alpha [Pseudooceanicola albus]
MTAPRFIHLRVHTEYSLLEGAMRLKKLPGLCAAAEMPAVAVTDTNNLFSALEFSVTASGQGIQPIIGCQVDVLWHRPEPGEKQKPAAPVVLLAQTEKGYENLMELSSCLFIDAGGEPPAVTLEELESHAEGLICLTGGADGPVGQLLQTQHRPEAQALLTRFAKMYPDRLYVELQRHPVDGGLPQNERLTERGFLEMAYAMELPLVATNDVYFPKPDMYAAHDAMICVAEGAYVDQAEPRRRLTPQHYFKSPQEMVTLFADLPEAIENTIEIAQRCAFMAYKRKPILPRFADDEVVELRRQAVEGLKQRLAVIPHAVSVEDYEARLEFELGIIEGMGFPGYFLIVADFIKWAKDHGIPVGPGRGSGAGSLVAYALTITDLDPLRYSLLFERFLNPERVSMPDFDIDFCMDRREEVIRYVQERYGRDKVGQIITFGALLSKAAVRDIGRVLQMPFGQVDRLSKLIPVEGVKPVGIAQALRDEPRLREEIKETEQDIRDGRVNPAKRLFEYAEQVEGLLRNASTHAAGVVIGDRPLDHLVPLYQDPRSDMPATQFNMKWVEQAGLVKFDFLGLKTLTVIQNAIQQIHGGGRDLHVAADGTQLYDPPPGGENEINLIPLDDPKTYELYSRARTVAVFQVESSGMMDALKQMKPTCIEDIVALVALYRPGPMENIPVYCEVKNGLREITSVHHTIDHILAETQGIIVYQEQVMQIAQVMAGYSLGGADLLRRAMGKKIKEAMDAERPKFEEGAAKNGVDAKKASEVFDLLEKFANYGFNKSHAAAYAVVSYQTAWLKANHPVEFMAGVMNCDIHLTEKLAVYFQEVKKALALPYTPPCVNRSDATFRVIDGALHYALGALKNVGVEAMELIVRGRAGKPFANLFDFARRVELKKVGKRPLEMLARAGAFDELDRNRRRVFDSLEGLVGYSAAYWEQKNSNQVSLFGDGGDDLPEPRLSAAQDWMPAERLAEEFKAIGFYLSGHPLDDYMGALKRKKVMTMDEVIRAAQGGPLVAKIAGIVTGRQERKSARGNRFAFAQLSDPTGGYEVTLFSDALEASREFLENGSKVVVTCKAEVVSDQLKLLADSVVPMDQLVADAGAIGLKIFLSDASGLGAVQGVLEGAVQSVRGVQKGPIHFCLVDPSLPGEVEIDAHADFPITPQVKGAIRTLPGVLTVEEI